MVTEDSRSKRRRAPWRVLVLVGVVVVVPFAIIAPSMISDKHPIVIRVGSSELRMGRSTYAVLFDEGITHSWVKGTHFWYLNIGNEWGYEIITGAPVAATSD